MRPYLSSLRMLAGLILGSPGFLSAQEGPLRTRSEIERILGPIDTSGLGKPRPLRILWVYSRPAEGAAFHNFEAQMARWRDLFGGSPNLVFDPAEKWPTPVQWQGADVAVFNFRLGANMSDGQYRDLDAFLDRGGGWLPLHVGVALQDGAPARYAPYAGLSWDWSRAKDRAGRVVVRPQADHPLATRLPDSLEFYEEMYFDLLQDTSGFRTLAWSRETGSSGVRPFPAFWTKTVRKGRVFGGVLGHFTATHDDPLFRLLLLRGLAWAAGENPHRFRDLVTRGARIKEDVTLARNPARIPRFHLPVMEAFRVRPDGRSLPLRAP